MDLLRRSALMHQRMGLTLRKSGIMLVAAATRR